MEYRVFSFGGGVQSHAALVLQIMGHITPYNAFVFANVGHDSENPDTIAYINEVTRWLCDKHNILFVEVAKGGPTLRERVMSEQKSIVIPAYTRRNGGRLRRNCTDDYKIAVIDDWIKAGRDKAVVGLGISVDEFERARSTDWYEDNGLMKKREYPLIDKRLTRQDCLNIIESFGLPEPPPSRCFYCPFNGLNDWFRLKRNKPELFDQAVEIDKRIRGKESSVQGRAYLHRRGIPLQDAVGDQMMMDDDADNCESGYCMT